MTYNLAEFKRWLEEEPSRKENLSDWNQKLAWLTSDIHLEKLIQQEDYEQVWFNSSKEVWKPYRKLALEWIQERERERERKGIPCLTP
jgi:hypothetical protein